MSSGHLEHASLDTWFARRSDVLLDRLTIELTERCNNDCVHCYINQPAGDWERADREMDTFQVQRIVSEAAKLGCMTVRFTGGEPLLREDFAEIYLHTRRRGMVVELCTNATLIDEEVADLLAMYPPGAPVDITLYGMSEHRYSSVARVLCGFGAAMDGIELLKNAGVPFSLRGVRIGACDDDIRKLEEFGAAQWADRPVAVTANFNLRARRDSELKNRRIAGLRPSPTDVVTHLTRDHQGYVADMKQFAARFMGPPGEQIFSCGCGNGGTVDAYGMLQPCLLLRHPDTVYDLRTGNLEDGLKHFFPGLRERVSENREYLARCARCFLHGLCEQCAAHSWMEHGTLDTPVEYQCEIAHGQARYLGLLLDGEQGWKVEEWERRIDQFIKDTNGDTEND